MSTDEADNVANQLPSLPGSSGLSKELEAILGGPQAPVLMPPTHMTAVQLVPRQLLEVAIQAMADASLYVNLAAAAAGAIASFVIVVATTAHFKWSRPGVGLITGLVTGFLVLAMVAYRASKRAREYRRQLLDAGRLG